jgi:hypothetical protein
MLQVLWHPLQVTIDSNAALISDLPEFATIKFGRQRKDLVQSSRVIWKSVVFGFDPFVYTKMWKDGALAKCI